MNQPTAHNSEESSEVDTALQRMTRAGQEVRQTHSMSVAKALRLSLAKVADKQMGLAMAVIAAKVERYEQAGLASLFEGGPLLMLLDGKMGRRGAAVFDAELVGALIQQQTMGKVSPSLDADPRPMTDTDAAICAPYMDAFLSQAAKLPDEARERALLDGFSFGARVGDTRLMLMALEQPAYQVIHLTVDVAAGARQGHIVLCMPEAAAADKHMTGHDDGTAKGEPAAPAMLDKTVLGLNVELHVALTALTLPLGLVQKIAVGDVFDLGITAFDEACVQTKEGRKLGSGVLGQINGTRALQLEHSSSHAQQPRRRVADRATLNLPNVAGDGTGTQKEDRLRFDKVSQEGDLVEGSLGTQSPSFGMRQADGSAEYAMPDVPPLGDLPDLADMPDMSDLPGMDDLADLSDLPDFDAADLDAKFASG